MFRNTKTMARTADNSLENTINRIVEGTRFQGEIVCDSNIRIDGHFTGDMETKGRVVIGPQGRVEGNVRCQNCEVEGRLKGKVAVEELLSLKQSATVEGEVHYGKLSIEAGAQLMGTVQLGGKIKDIKQREEAKAGLAEQTA